MNFPVMNALFSQQLFRYFSLLFVFSPFARLRAEDAERFYSMSEVAAIDHENKLWRMVDASQGVEANIQHLLADGIPATDVEKFKPRLIELWGDIDPSLQIDWLDEGTLTRIMALMRPVFPQKSE